MKLSYKRLGLLLYFFFTGWGIFWVLSFFKLAAASAQIPQTAQIDIAFSEAEYEVNRTISGSYQEGFNVPCTGGWHS